MHGFVTYTIINSSRNFQRIWRENNMNEATSYINFWLFFVVNTLFPYFTRRTELSKFLGTLWSLLLLIITFWNSGKEIKKCVHLSWKINRKFRDSVGFRKSRISWDDHQKKIAKISHFPKKNCKIRSEKKSTNYEKTQNLKIYRNEISWNVWREKLKIHQWIFRKYF